MVSALIACRTAALGGHLQRCDHCGRENPLYNSCRNRHCPKCQSLDQALWVEAQLQDLLPIPYFHDVFTLPALSEPVLPDRTPARARAAVRSRGEDRDRRVPKQSRGHPRPHRPAPHLESAPRASPAHPLHRHRRRPEPGRQALDLLQADLLPAGLEAVRGLSGKAARGLRARPKRRAPAQGGRGPSLVAARRCPGLRRLLQAPDGGTRAGPALPRPLHAPNRHRQRTHPRSREGRGYLQLQGPPARRRQKDQDPSRDRVHPPLPAPRRPQGWVRGRCRST